MLMSLSSIFWASMYGSGLTLSFYFYKLLLKLSSGISGSLKLLDLICTVFGAVSILVLLFFSLRYDFFEKDEDSCLLVFA